MNPSSFNVSLSLLRDPGTKRKAIDHPNRVTHPAGEKVSPIRRTKRNQPAEATNERRRRIRVGVNDYLSFRKSTLCPAENRVLENTWKGRYCVGQIRGLSEERKVTR